ncbi:MAG: DUF1501 domain-containing protein, partial [Verrucomicrobia bacterium]|nr:DUF1501 domain-containing protein [Verrucomicrobiota bacterium]
MKPIDRFPGPTASETPSAASATRLTRRAALERLLLGAAGLWAGSASLSRAVQKAPAPRAKAVIQIWMWGGPCHLDTFDPKPEAGYDYCGPFDKPIQTVTGERICQMLPLLAKQADKFSVIRSMTHGINAHETASYLVQTGHMAGDGQVYPCVGAVIALFKAFRAGYKGLIPPYVALTQPQGRFSEAGFLGNRYKPFATGGDPARTPFAVEGVVAQGITRDRQRARRDLLRKLDRLRLAAARDPAMAALTKAEAAAYDLILGDAGKAFDLAEEPDKVRERYGRHTFGQACLAARRLVERGVPYVTINYKGWDTHKQHFQAMRRMLPQLDQGMSALLEDLAARGLLETTIVWWSG